MKKIIWIIGLLFLTIVIILNLVLTSNIEQGEHINIEANSLLYILGTVLVSLLLFLITRALNNYFYKEENLEKKKKLRRNLTIGAITLYILFSIIWIILVRPYIVGDSIHVCNLAQTFYRGNLEEFMPNMTYAGIPLSQYMQVYPQQLSQSFVFSIVFRIIHFDIMEVLRVFNIICNIGIVFALYKITNQLGLNYSISKTLFFTLILTFLSLPMLSTFIYGDIPSLALCLFLVYFMMKYTKNKQIKYAIFASILTMIAYMLRMNSLIFIIATTMYLIFSLIAEITKKTWKQNLLEFLIIIMYILISIVPSKVVQNYYLDKYNLEKGKTYPTASYILMAMQEGPRANGWYNEEIAEYALKNIENAKIEYPQKIKERLTYFSKNLGYTFEFYTEKIASMWTETTYSAIWNNTVGEEDNIKNITGLLTFYQKAWLILTCVCTLIVLIQNRKSISLDLLLLLTIFIGGFAFHILWEAKSRYIIPYILVLIPIACIQIKQYNIIEKIRK